MRPTADQRRKPPVWHTRGGGGKGRKQIRRPLLGEEALGVGGGLKILFSCAAVVKYHFYNIRFVAKAGCVMGFAPFRFTKRLVSIP